MAQPVASRSWVCERDNQDAASPFCAKLLIKDDQVASARGIDEMTAFANLIETLHARGIAEGRALGFEALMRAWSEYKRRSTDR